MIPLILVNKIKVKKKNLKLIIKKKNIYEKEKKMKQI